MTTLELAGLLAFAHRLGDVAREIAARAFTADVPVDRKDDRTPVTAVDREIEAVWRDAIAREHPGHGVLGEEAGGEHVDREWVWVLDPIDGTKAFASGNPLFGSLIGLMHRGVPVVGVLEAPALRQRWSAAQGHGAHHDGRPIRVRRERALADAVLYCTTPDAMLDDPGFAALRRRVQWTSYGGDCCAYAFVASGRADLVVDVGLKPWDWCALVPIVQEAGGVLFDASLRTPTLRSVGAFVCASGAALAQQSIAR